MKKLLFLATAFFTPLLVPLADAEQPKETPKPIQAIAILQPTAGNKVMGTITFTKTADGIHVMGEVSGLAPGNHGFHVHEFGDVSSPDGKSAGGHFNPTGEMHGGPDADHRHAGDFGNIEAAADGTVKIDFVDKRIQFDGDKSILGRGIVIHAKGDDFKSQPSGDAGDRVAVAVIGVAKSEGK